MINPQLTSNDIISFGNRSIEELQKNRVEFENLRVKLVQKRGKQNLEFCLRIIERIGVVVAAAPLVLAFAVSPWTLLITPVAIIAWGFLGAVNQSYFGSYTDEKDQLARFKARLEGSSIPSGRVLKIFLDREELLIKERAKFFYGDSKYVVKAKGLERTYLPHMETLKAIAHLFSSVEYLRQEKSTEFKQSIQQARWSLPNSNLTSEEKEAFTVLLDKITQNPDSINSLLKNQESSKRQANRTCFPAFLNCTK